MIMILLAGLLWPNGAHAADRRVRLDSGEEVILKDNKTWDFVGSPAELAVSQFPKHSEDAIEIWDKSLLMKVGDYKKSVALQLHPLNKTQKKIIGYSVYVRVLNPFGKVVLENTFEDEGVIEPEERKKSDSFWSWDDNQFINGEPYDLMWQIAQAGTARIETSVRKVVFEDGVVLERKAAKRKK